MPILGNSVSWEILAEIVGTVRTPSTSVDSYCGWYDIDWYASAEIGEQIYIKSSQRKMTEVRFE